MFPKISQGPITKYASVISGIKKPVIKIDTISNGLRRFVAGLAKKVLVADYLGVVSSKVFAQDPNSLNPAIAWYGLIAFSIQVFLDFSAYSDMAIGLGNVLGFELPENFNFPYISKSITEFWRRWHITLTTWFRSYFFIPLEIARRKVKRFRLETNVILVFLATGLWHGIGLNYIIWGLYHGIIIALEANFLANWLKKINPVFQHALTLLLITFGWVFFRIQEISSWSPFFRSLFGLNSSNIQSLRSLRILAYWPIFLIGVLLCLPIIRIIPFKVQNNPWFRTLTDCLLVIILLISISLIASGNYRAFLYAEF
jgi:alginate O-acetyltransferase complex protein AlgI